MSLWTFIDNLLDLISWLSRWRFNLCFFAGVVLAFIAVGWLSFEPWSWIVGGMILVTAIVVGCYWESSV
jgi:hypothetical protein